MSAGKGNAAGARRDDSGPAANETFENVPFSGMESKLKEQRTAGEWQEASRTPFQYRRLWLGIVVSACLVSFIPLIVIGISS